MVPSGMVPTGRTFPMFSWAAKRHRAATASLGGLGRDYIPAEHGRQQGPALQHPKPQELGHPQPSPALPSPTFLAAVHELPGVDALGGDEQLRAFLEAVRVAEGDLGQRSAPPGVMDDVLGECRAALGGTRPLQEFQRAGGWLLWDDSQSDTSQGDLGLPRVRAQDSHLIPHKLQYLHPILSEKIPP